MLRASLVQRIVLPLGAVAMLLQLGLAAYALNHERTALAERIDARATRLAQTARAFDLSGDAIDDNQVAQWLGTTLLEQDDVLFCEVTAGPGRTLFRGGSCDERDGRGYAFDLALSAGPRANGNTISPSNASEPKASTGTLYLTLSTAAVEQTLSEARGALTIAILGGTATICLLTTLLVRHTVRHAALELAKEREAATSHLLSRQTSSPNSSPLEQLGEAIDTGGTTPQDEPNLTYGKIHPGAAEEEQAEWDDQTTPVTSISERDN